MTRHFHLLAGALCFAMISFPASFLLLSVASASDQRLPYGDPTDLSLWQTYRSQVQHPAGLIKAGDLERAQKNIAQFPWAKNFLESTQKRADLNLEMLANADFLTKMVEVTTAGSTSPCPACRDKGMRWLPNNVWNWSINQPEQITCNLCKTVFPNEAYPETVVLTSTWDPRQVFRFVEGPTFHCFGYKHSRSNPAGIIRARKLGYVINMLEPLAVSYALTEKPQYAAGTRKILLRLAEVVPTYLVRAGYTYNEYADCHPHEAAKNIHNLPTDELVVPPNAPDRKLWTGYWSASKFNTSGMDGGIAVRMATAYDLTCNAKDENGQPIFTEDEKLRIERDVLLETAYLALCDTLINNKSVGNRAGAAVVGLVVGHPLMVRFGLDGFIKTVDDWFLPDGGTSESAAYAMMTMSCVSHFAYAFRDYSEPEGFTPPTGAMPLKNFNACRDTEYGMAWQGLIWTMQGNLRFPPLADSYVTTAISAPFAELIALGYPTTEHLALARVKSGDNPTGAAARSALFYRDPGHATRTDIPASPTLPDVVFPYLAQGFLRLGEWGRGGLALLDASNWGGHHHIDSLNLYLWKDGHELLSDLGYLWDHPDKPKTARTMAHNLVLIDDANQKRQGRGGSFDFFAVSPRLKAMRASSKAYDAASVYERTIVQIDHDELGAYWVDLFRAQGGEKRDYVFHGPNNDFQIEGVTIPAADPEKLYARRDSQSGQPWKAIWKLSDTYRFAAYSPGHPAETLQFADEWGQRNHRNTDRGATLPYFFRQRTGPQLDAFVQVFAGFQQDQELVREVTVTNLGENSLAVTITLTSGKQDVVLFGDGNNQQLAPAQLATDALLAVATGLPPPGAATNRPASILLLGGTQLRLAEQAWSCPQASWHGTIASQVSSGGNSWFDLAGNHLPTPAQCQGLALIVSGEDGIKRAYPIQRAETTNQGQLRIHTRVNFQGFPAKPANEWQLPAMVFK